jgi:hypothetical protein
MLLMMVAMEVPHSMPSNSSMNKILLMRLAPSTLLEVMTTAKSVHPSISVKIATPTNHASFQMNITPIVLINMETLLEKML